MAFKGLALASQHLDWASLGLGGTDILPCVLQDIVPFGSAALLHIHIINKILAGQGYR